MFRLYFSCPAARFSDERFESNRTVRFLVILFTITTAISWFPSRAWAQTPTVSSIKLSITSGGSVVTSVSSGTVVSLTVSVMAGGGPVTAGLVNFCDAAASDCLGIHQLATVQVASGGMAVYRFRPGPGSRLFKAVFVGTNSVAGAISAQSSLTVVAPAASALATTTTMSRTGSWGNYTLGATVTEIGSTATPAGTVSFVDTDNGNTVLGSGALGAGVPGTGWLSSTLTPVSRALKNLATGDFNEDGIADIAANFIDASNNSSLAILLGHGDGTFAAPSFTLPVGHGPTFIIIGDLNQDGHQDFALHGSVDDTATIFLGKGDGTFTTGSTFLINGSLASIVTGDFNGDGKADLAFASVYPSNLSIYFNNGDGTFSLGSSIPLPANCLSLMAVDLNADGKTDIVVGSPNIVMLLLGAGDGTFTSTTGLTTPREAASFATGDFNGDGQLDLAVGNFNNTEGETAPVSIFLGNGNGTFNLVPSSISVPSPSSIAVVDLNQDGISDLVIPNYVGSGVSVLFGKGDGTFAPSPVVPTTTSIPSGTVAVDVNGDGIPDLLTGNFDSTISIDITRPTVTATTPTVTILPSAPGAHLVNASYPGSTLYQPSTSTADLLWGQPPATATALVVTAGGGAVSTVPANTVIALTATVTAGGSPITSGQINFCDVMAPNCADIHLIGSAQVTSTGTAVFRFVPGSGIHQYKAVFLESAVGVSSTSPSATLIVQAPAAIPVPTITTIAQSGSVGNYTLAATVSSVGSHEPLTGNVTFEDTNNSNAVLTSAQLGTGTAGIAWVPTFTATQGNPNFLQFAGGDFNGDGHPDVATINSNTLTVNIYLGNGDATYTTGTSLTLATLATYATGVVAGDFNGDGILDLAVTGSSYTAGSLAIYFGHGDGTFAQAAAALTVGYLAQVFAAVDINGDGKLDLIINEYYAGTRILFGNGDGSFSQGPVNGLATTAAVADLNGDGMPDIVAGNSGEVYLGNGDGTFHPAAALPVSFYGPVVSVGDFNGDGILDLSINSQDYSGVAILLGKGDGTFTQAADTPSVSINEPLASAVGDFNRDGKLDILISNENAYQGNTINPDLTLLLGNGDGTFTKGALDTQFNGTAAILVQDVNGDGTADIILDTGVMSVLLTEPTQTYVATVTGVAVTGPGPHSVEAVYAGDTNYTTSTSTTTSLLSQVAAPTFSLSAGTYTSVQTVTITDATPGATMYYSLNGPTNSTGAFVPYPGAVSLPSSGSYTLQAYAIATGYQQSSTSSATYILNLPPVTTPTLSPAPGVYSSAQIVTITETVPGATVYYTVNGRRPSTSSSVYSVPIPINETEALYVLATAPGYSNSLSGGQYVITPGSAITWSTPSAISYGTALGNGQLDATASILGTFTYSPAAGTILTAGSHTLTATFTPTNTQLTPVSTASVTLIVNPATPKISWATPSAITSGTALSGAQLNATGSVPGTFVYSPPAGSVLPVGNETLSATFRPSDATDYTPATASVVLAVANPIPVLSALTPAYTKAGGPTFSLNVSGASFVLGSTVIWGSTPLATQYVSATELIASVPASAIGTPAMTSVTVQTSAPGGGYSRALQFELDSPATQWAGSPKFTIQTTTVSPGSSASYAVTLPPFVSSASVSCLGLPPGANCSYANGAVTVATTANTPTGTYGITVVFTEMLPGVATGFFSLPFLLLPLAIQRWRLRGTKRLMIVLTVLTLMTGGLFFTGCASGGGSFGVGTITHQATSSATVTLIVQ